MKSWPHGASRAARRRHAGETVLLQQAPNGATERDLLAIYRPRPGMPCTVVPLANGNYVVASGAWDNGATTNAGAITFGSGTSGVVGEVSAANSLVGSTTNDSVGSGGVTGAARGGLRSPGAHRLGS